MLGFLNRLGRSLQRAAFAVTRRGAGAVKRGTVVVQPYRGYGSRVEVFLIGRVFHEPSISDDLGNGVRQKLAILWRLFCRWGIADATLTARFGGTLQEVRTDRDGYFSIDLQMALPPPSDRVWHTVSLRLTDPVVIDAEAEVFIPPDTCRLVVISDIDDTVVYTGVANKLMMMWRLFMQDAGSRVAFPGMAAFLSALHRGVDGNEFNPLLYVSRAPWSIYGVLDEFFSRLGIPIGPILFLREWGLTLQSPLPRRAKGHKLDLIWNMLSLYDSLPFVLIGDSGQHDPEIYADVVRAHRKRVLAVYIRNVSADPERDRAIATLAAEIAEAGSSLVLAADTIAMAEHAAAHGLIANGALGNLRMEKAEYGIKD